jgi:hypothetical protein
MQPIILSSDPEFDALDTAFSLMIKVRWLSQESYRAGTLTLLRECTTIQQLDAVQHVLEKLKYCTSRDLQEAAIDAADAILNGWQLLPQETLVVGLAEGSKTCGSTAYVRAIEVNLPRSWADSIWTTFDSAYHR